MLGRTLALALLAMPAASAFMAPSPSVIRQCTDFTHLAPYTAAQILGQPRLSTVTEPFLSGPTRLRAPVATGSQVTIETKAAFKINLMGDTSISVKNFEADACVSLGAETNKLIAAFKAIKDSEAEGGKRAMQESFTFTWTDGTTKLEMECNPNLFTNAFNAKVFVVFEDTNVRVSAQAALPELIDSIKEFKSKLVPA